MPTIQDLAALNSTGMAIPVNNRSMARASQPTQRSMPQPSQPPPPQPTVDDIMNMPIMNERQAGQPSPELEFLDSILKNPALSGKIGKYITRAIAIAGLFAALTNPVTMKMFNPDSKTSVKSFLAQNVIFIIMYVILTCFVV